MTNSAALEESAREFVQLWSGSIGGVMGQVASVPFPVEITDTGTEALPAPSEGDAYLMVTAAGAARGEMSFRIPAAGALDLVKVFMGDTDVARSELTTDDRSALEELFRQIAGHVSTSARPRWKELPFTVVLAQAPTWSPGASGWLCSGSDAPRKIQIEWRLSSALTASLQAAWKTEGAAIPTAVPQFTASPPDASNFDLLMNIELDVTVRFGGRDILLREILELSAGSVLELDREVQDPADLLLDGKLIARGEVVVVDGNFGMRIIKVFAGPQLSA